MNIEELRQEAEEYLRHQTHLNGGGIFHCNILNLILGFAEPREKRIAELEKENAELKKSCDETQELLDKQIEATYKLDKENAELKERLKEHESVGNSQFWKNVWSWKTKAVQLVKAKEIINTFVDWKKGEGGYDLPKDFLYYAEQFSKEITENDRSTEEEIDRITL